MRELAARTEVARVLNRAGISAAPLARLDAISIFDDEEYENYDVDMVSPRRRRRIAAALGEAGFRHRSGRRFEAPEGEPPLLFPKPGILGTDPSGPPGALLDAGDATVLLTPTQALLLYLLRLGDEPAALVEELSALVWEQPANLDKVRQWARAAGREGAFAAIRGALEQAQAEGIALRRRREFRSRLPH